MLTLGTASLITIGGLTYANASGQPESASTFSTHQLAPQAAPSAGGSIEENLEINFAKGLSDVEYEAYQKLTRNLSEIRSANLDAIHAARSVCYSALSSKGDHSLIMVPLPDNTVDLDAVCHIGINGGWHAGGVAKGAYFSQDCRMSLENTRYGGGYTSYVTEHRFENNRPTYNQCGPDNAFICCSPQFPN